MRGSFLGVHCLVGAREGGRLRIFFLPLCSLALWLIGVFLLRCLSMVAHSFLLLLGFLMLTGIGDECVF